MEPCGKTSTIEIEAQTGHPVEFQRLLGRETLRSNLVTSMLHILGCLSMTKWHG